MHSIYVFRNIDILFVCVIYSQCLIFNYISKNDACVCVYRNKASLIAGMLIFGCANSKPFHFCLCDFVFVSVLPTVSTFSLCAIHFSCQLRVSWVICQFLSNHFLWYLERSKFCKYVTFSTNDTLNSLSGCCFAVYCALYIIDLFAMLQKDMFVWCLLELTHLIGMYILVNASLGTKQKVLCFETLM